MHVRLVLLAAILGLASCSSDGPNEPAPDHSAPVVTVVREANPGGGARVRLRVSWQDPDGPLTNPQIAIRSERPTVGLQAGLTDLTAEWSTLREANNGLVITETGSALLPAGSNDIEVAITDAAGHTGSAHIQLDLPAFELDARYTLGGEGGLGNVVACEDERHIFVPGYHRMVIIDPDDGYLRSLTNPFAFDEANAICAADERAVYLASGAQRFDRDILRFGPLLPQTGQTAASIAQAPDAPELLFLGQRGARIVLANKTSLQTVGTLQVPSSIPDAPVVSIVPLPAADRLIVAVSGDGIVLLDRSGGVIARVTGTPQDLKLTADRTRLLAAMNADGLLELDPGTLGQRRQRVLAGGVRVLGLRTDNRIAFTGAAAAAADQNYIIDLKDFSILAALPRARTTLRTESGAAWEFGGRRLFVAYGTPEGPYVEVFLDRS
jgi:hypothetical protein